MNQKKLTREELLKIIKIYASLFDNCLIYLYGGLSGKKNGRFMENLI